MTNNDEIIELHFQNYLKTTDYAFDEECNFYGVVFFKLARRIHELGGNVAECGLVPNGDKIPGTRVLFKCITMSDDELREYKRKLYQECGATSQAL